MNRPPTGGEAFLKGGCGCLVVFAALGFLGILAGGHVRVSLGGLVFLFLVGGVIGLVMLAAYKRGRRDSGEQ